VGSFAEQKIPPSDANFKLSNNKKGSQMKYPSLMQYIQENKETIKARFEALYGEDVPFDIDTITKPDSIDSMLFYCIRYKDQEGLSIYLQERWSDAAKEAELEETSLLSAICRRLAGDLFFCLQDTPEEEVPYEVWSFFDDHRGLDIYKILLSHHRFSSGNPVCVDAPPGYLEAELEANPELSFLNLQVEDDLPEYTFPPVLLDYIRESKSLLGVRLPAGNFVNGDALVDCLEQNRSLIYVDTSEAVANKRRIGHVDISNPVYISKVDAESIESVAHLNACNLAISIRENETPKELNFEGVYMDDDETFRMIIRGFKINSSTTTIRFSQECISEAKMDCLMEALEDNLFVTSVVINQSCCVDGCRHDELEAIVKRNIAYAEMNLLEKLARFIVKNLSDHQALEEKIQSVAEALSELEPESLLHQALSERFNFALFCVAVRQKNELAIKEYALTTPVGSKFYDEVTIELLSYPSEDLFQYKGSHYQGLKRALLLSNAEVKGPAVRFIASRIAKILKEEGEMISNNTLGDDIEALESDCKKICAEKIATGKASPEWEAISGLFHNVRHEALSNVYAGRERFFTWQTAGEAMPAKPPSATQ